MERSRKSSFFLVFFCHACAHFLLLALNTRVDGHADYESMARNRVSNISFTVCSAGEIIILAVMVGIIKGLKADQSTENNTKAFSVLIAFSGAVWRK